MKGFINSPKQTILIVIAVLVIAIVLYFAYKKFADMKAAADPSLQNANNTPTPEPNATNTNSTSSGLDEGKAIFYGNNLTQMYSYSRFSALLHQKQIRETWQYLMSVNKAQLMLTLSKSHNPAHPISQLKQDFNAIDGVGYNSETQAVANQFRNFLTTLS